MERFTKFFFLIVAVITTQSAYAMVSGAVLQQQVSPNHNMAHLAISLVNISQETFNNVTVTVVLPSSLFYIRDHIINSGTASVDEQTVTWVTGDSSVTNKQYHFFCVAHQPGIYQLTVHVTDNQGVEHTYTSNHQTLNFPHIINGAYAIATNGILTFNGQNLIIDNLALETEVVRIAIQPAAEHGSVDSNQLTTPPFALTYTPDRDFVGYDYFSVQAFDENGDGNGKSVFVAVGVESDPESYTTFLRHLYNPKPISHRPITRSFALSYTVDAGDIPIYLIDYSLHLHNSKRPFTYTIDTSGATHGVPTCTPEGVFMYASGSVTGTDVITYRMTDDDGFYCDATITIDVVPFNG